MAASTNISSTTLSLWDQAFNSLGNDLRNSLNSTRTHKRDILEAVLKEIEAKRDLAIRKKWKFKKSNGDVIVVRDVLEKISRWIYRFKETGDVIAQYDPVHLSLPWAAFRFLLQIAVSEVQVFGAMTDDLETIARIVIRYREFERIYLQGMKLELDLMLEEALTRLYAEILTHLARAVRFFGEKSMVRLLKSPFRTADEGQIHKILAQEAEVLKIAKLKDTDKLLYLEATVTRLSIEAATYSQSHSEQKYNKILEWLSASPSYSHHQFLSQSRLPGLGKWLLEHKDYIDWQTSSSSSLLLLDGITGSGKSMLCSMIVDSLLSTTNNHPSAAPFGYIYCANPDVEKARHSSDDVMRTILSQLALDKTGRHKVKDFLCSEYERQIARASIAGLDLLKLRTQDCVRLILELAEQDPLTIIVDAIDTIKEKDQHAVISAMKKIVSEADNVVKVFITSRSSNRAIIAPAADKQIQITSHETQQDMATFVNHLIDNAVTSRLLLEGQVSSALRSMLIQALLDGAGEMFLWVKLQIERLCREKVEDDVFIALQSKLPEDLHQLYEESLNHIFHASTIARDTAVKAFSWILHMRESLTPSALLAVISNAQSSTLQLTQLMAICANLIVVDKECNVIRFAHQSVKEFLESHDYFTGAVAHNSLASTCIEVCSRGPVSGRNLQLPNDDFYVYAAMYWPVHSKMAESTAANNDIVDKMTSFIFDEEFDTTLSFDSWLGTKREVVAILANDHAMKLVLDAIPDCGAGFLFLISVFGLTGLLRMVLERVADLDVNQKNKHGHTPVYLAAAFGHSITVSVLVEHGAIIDVEGGKYGSPLHAACFAGHLEVVDNLLKLGASVSCGIVFVDAFQAACRGSQEDLALHLIKRSSMIECEDDYEQALEGAARAGFVNVIGQLQRPPFLLFNKNKIDRIKKKTRKAIEGGQLGVIRQFLDQQIDKRDALPLDAVALATLYNHKMLVEFLLDEGMDVEAEGAVGTPLRTACLLNYQPIARLLLHRGAEINSCGSFGDALQAGAMKGHTTIMKLIIDEGANVNQQSGFYGTALQAAAYHGQHGAVELLLDAGADVHAKGYSRDAFHAAAEGGHEHVIMLMLRKGYKFSLPRPQIYANMSVFPQYKALIRDASPGRTFDLYRGRERGFDRHRRRNLSWPPKDTSAEAKIPIIEHEAIFRAAKGESELRKTGKISAIGYRLQLYSQRENFPLEAAASAGHVGTVKLLLKQRDMLGIPNEEISHAIEVAASNSHWPVVQLLLDDVAKWESIKSQIETILQNQPQGQKSQIVDFALAQASKHCSADEIVELNQRLITPADKYRHDSKVSQETLVLDFQKSCKTGNVQVIDAILRSKYHKALSSHEIDDGLQLCASNGQSTVIQILLESPALKERQPPSGEEVFVIAASSGFVNIMKSLTSYWMEELNTTSSVAILRALVVASSNGHIDVVRYLVQDMSADINNLAHDKPVGPGLYKSQKTSPSFASVLGDPKGQLQANQEEPSGVPVISPLQAALRGFIESISSDAVNKSGMAEQPQYEEVIMFLLDSGSKPNDLGGQNVYAIQQAAKFCSSHIVGKFIAAGTDVNATKDGESALFAATGRELSAAPIVRRLLTVGATIPEEVEEQKELLEQALRYFRVNTSWDHPDGQFLVAPSLEDVFNEGPGAVLFNLLHRMSRITTTDNRWTLVLQMVAFLDNHPFVDLLLSRGTDINAVGSYYGTALEAAARCGHISMVRKLLDADAKVNVLAGRWQTALRAALVGGHTNVVETLLEHGADMELGCVSEKDSETALQLGVKSGNLNIVKTLLKHGANAVLDETETLHPLILASQQGNMAVVKELLSAGAPVNIHGKIQPPYGYIQTEDASPIHAAIFGGYLDVSRLLLSRGADIKNDVEGVSTPLDVAAFRGSTDIVRLLLSGEANVIDDAALSRAVEGGSIEIAQELLAAGSKAEPVLALACRQGSLPMIELLLEKIYDGEKAETVIDEAFAIHGLDDSVFRLLLDYAPPTMRRFVQVCASGSLASVRIMLDEGGIDINGQNEANGDYPLQIAASYLQAEVVRFLLLNGADVNCKSSKHGTPLMIALEACAATTLRSLESENAKELVDKLFLPNSVSERAYYDYIDSAPSRFQQLSACEKIVRLLVIHGANTTDDSRPFGPPLHLACLLGSKALVELLLEKGADPNATAGFFDKAIFAAVQGGHADIVEILLQKAPLTKHIHSEYASPLHLACAIGSGASVRKLLEHGADATVLDANGQTPLTIALKKRKKDSRRYQNDSLLDVILKFAKSLHVLDDDLMAAAELRLEALKILTSLLDIAKGMLISEALICHVFNRSCHVNDQMIKLLMPRSGGIGVTTKMLEAIRSHDGLEELLKHKPVCRITPKILKSQETLKGMKLLLDIDPEAPVNEEIVFRALEIANTWRKEDGNSVLEALFDRSPDIAVTQEMLQAGRCAEDMEVLLKRLKPGTRISTNVVTAISTMERWDAYLIMRPLLKFDPSIKVDPKMALRMMRYSDDIDVLKMLLEDNPSMPITEKMFLRLFRLGYQREKLADLMHKYETRLVFTDQVREVIDQAYRRRSEAAMKKRFYDLQLIDEICIESMGKSGNEETPETTLGRNQSDSDSDDNYETIDNLFRGRIPRNY